MSQNKDVPLREVLTLQLFFMRIDILTVLPEMIEGMINCSIVKRAQDKGLAEIHLHNLRDYTTNKWRRVDDYPFGGEAGMVMQIEPIDRAISALKSEREYDEVIYTSPDGETLNQPMANSMSLLNNMIILCGHYKGIDYRIREHLITKEISVGDYVLTGGAPSPTPSKMTYWPRLFIHVPPITKVGKYPRYYYPGTSARSKNGACNKHKSVRHASGRIY